MTHAAKICIAGTATNRFFQEVHCPKSFSDVPPPWPPPNKDGCMFQRLDGFKVSNEDVSHTL